MPDYGEILRFLARNPPQLEAERDLHASLLELMAKCLREEVRPLHEEQPANALACANENEADAVIASSHQRWVQFG